MPKVSVIIPVYNVEKYLRECIDSVVNQTLKDIEIICIDDGSTDNSVNILKEYAANDDRFIILEQANQGAGAARNKGLEIAQGEFIAFMDGDDLYPNNNVLEKLYTGAKEHNVKICGGSLVELIDAVRSKPKKNDFCFDKDSIIDFHNYQFIYGYWRYVYNLEFLRKNDIKFPHYRRFQDPIFCLKALHKAENFYAISDNVYVYRIIRKDEKYLNPIIKDLVLGIKVVLDYAKENKLYNVYRDLIRKILVEYYSLKFQCIEIEGKDCFDFLFDISKLSDNQIENIDEYFEKSVLLSSLNNKEYLRAIFKNIEDYNHKSRYADMVVLWGSKMMKPQPETMRYAIENDIPLIKAEDGFLRSADTWCNKTVDKKYITGISYQFTNDVFYFDATQSSYMERQINNPEFVLTEKQRIRAKNAIKFIIENHLTKYNHQPIYTPKIGRAGVKKILVVDQSYGDFSISKGLANDDTFKEMLDTAIRENPDADIIIKTHPDAMAPGTGRATGYYSTIEPHDNIYLLREPINPISILKYVDKVYVCTTQFGFEALMCGKEVHTFGMPFYAGWGLTIDKLTCSRRTTKRTLEEIFYIAYIKNTHYIDPINKRECSIEEAMSYLISLRDDYNKYKKNIKRKKFIKSVFSIQNIGVHKVICILGIKLKIKSKKLVERKRYKDLDKKIKKLSKELKTVKELINAQQ